VGRVPGSVRFSRVSSLRGRASCSVLMSGYMHGSSLVRPTICRSFLYSFFFSESPLCQFSSLFAAAHLRVWRCTFQSTLCAAGVFGRVSAATSDVSLTLRSSSAFDSQLHKCNLETASVLCDRPVLASCFLLKIHGISGFTFAIENGSLIGRFS